MAYFPKSECTLTERRFRTFVDRGVIIEKKFRLNYEITAPEVHLIMEDGSSAGVITIGKARFLAAEHSLDLVEMNSAAQPPIVKLIDYNKYRYQQEKQARSMTRQKNELKEIRLGYKTDTHDLEVKARKAREFLEEGSFVRVFINLRGRENIFVDKAKQTLLDFQGFVGADIEQSITHEGKKVQIILKANKNAQTKNS